MEAHKPTILFVDEDVSVLDGLGRGFYSLSGSFDIVTANSALDAVTIVTARPVDVIITDLKVAGMDGVDLLAQVQRLSPETTRIILSGGSDRDMPFRTVGAAHQLFTKPCSTVKLAEAIVRALAVRKRLRTPELVELVSGVKSIPSIPKALTDLLVEIQSPAGSVAGLARIIGSDVGLTAQVLKVANSGFFRTATPINDVVHAVRLLGFEAIRTLVVLGGVFESFKNSGVDLATASRLQGRSLSIGMVARRIAVSESMSQSAVEQSQSAGMLAHIGSLILAWTFAAEIPLIHAEIETNGKSVVVAERAHLGVSHADLGAALLDLWGFPGDVVEAVLFHHEPGMSGATKGMSPMTAVHAAQVLVKTPTNESAGLDVDYLNRVGCVSHVETWREIAHSTLEEFGAAINILS